MDSFPQSAVEPFLRAGMPAFRTALRDVTAKKISLGKVSIVCQCGNHLALERRKWSLTRPLYFVYRAGTSLRGSVLLRVHQLAEAMASSVNNPEEIKVVTEELLHKIKPRDSNIIFSKYTLNESNLAWIANFRKSDNHVLVDIVDGFGSAEIDQVCDGYLCSSRTEFRYRLDSGANASYLPHQVDSRWPRFDFDKTSFQMVYMGGKGGSLHLDAVGDIATEVTPLSMTDAATAEAAGRVSGGTHHYSVRKFFGDGVFKPATKAFVAARFGAVFLGSASDEESVLTLGRDYPYLSETSEIDDVSAAVEFAKRSFGGEPWKTAVDVMRRLANETCDVEIGNKMAQMLSK
jgi:hypothetical protein